RDPEIARFWRALTRRRLAEKRTSRTTAMTPERSLRREYRKRAPNRSARDFPTSGPPERRLGVEIGRPKEGNPRLACVFHRNRAGRPRRRELSQCREQRCRNWKRY